MNGCLASSSSTLLRRSSALTGWPPLPAPIRVTSLRTLAAASQSPSISSRSISDPGTKQQSAPSWSSNEKSCGAEVVSQSMSVGANRRQTGFSSWSLSVEEGVALEEAVAFEGHGQVVGFNHLVLGVRVGHVEFAQVTVVAQHANREAEALRCLDEDQGEVAPLQVIHAFVHVGDVGEPGVLQASGQVAPHQSRDLPHESVAEQLRRLWQGEGSFTEIQPPVQLRRRRGSAGLRQCRSSAGQACHSGPLRVG